MPAFFVESFMNSPFAIFCCIYSGGDARAFVHRHIRERFAENPVVDRPGAFADAVSSLGFAKRIRSVELGMQVASGLKARMNTFHQAFAHLVGKPVTLEDNGVVIVERLDEVHVVPQSGDKALERLNG